MSTRQFANGSALEDVQLDSARYDAEQIRLMEERLIIVDNDDNPIGDGSKKECHLMANINPPRSLLHRAFSVFVFRPSDGRLLLQRRADEKITFPGMWTNTCCSHPLHVASEMDRSDHEIGARRAAQRKLDHELGIKSSQVPLDRFVFLTRIHYLAPSDGLWGEHEIDYVLFTTADVDLDINLNEVSDTKWVDRTELETLFADSSLTFTPWFKLIAKSFLYRYWDALLARTRAQSLLEGTSRDAPSHPIGTAPVAADIAVMHDLVTDEERATIHRML